jgi:hypothetical protein
MRKALGVLFGAMLAVVVTAGSAGAAVPPPHCDPAACPDPVDIAERVLCYVGEQLGFECID